MFVLTHYVPKYSKDLYHVFNNALVQVELKISNDAAKNEIKTKIKEIQYIIFRESAGVDFKKK